MVRLITIPTLALALLVAPVFGGDEKNLTYLALGDSIAFGLDPTLLSTQPNQPLPKANRFTGYPERVAIFVRQSSGKQINAACPGETSGSFLNTAGTGHGLPRAGGFKAVIGLHAAYTGSQVRFASSVLASNKQINLVTLGIGDNDLVLLQQKCAKPDPGAFAACVLADLNDQTNGTFATYGRNLFAILGAIRANYHGTLILMKSYTPNTDPLFAQAIMGLNQVMMDVGAFFGAKYADGFAAFQFASAPFGGDPCKAGLLIRLSQPPRGPLVCDVHPTPYGRDVLAVTVLAAIGNIQQGNNQ